jgi:hypothetical protein
MREAENAAAEVAERDEPPKAGASLWRVDDKPGRIRITQAFRHFAAEAVRTLKQVRAVALAYLRRDAAVQITARKSMPKRPQESINPSMPDPRP